MNKLTKSGSLQSTRRDPFQKTADFERGLERFFSRPPDADYKDGVPSVRLPATSEAKTRAVEVKAA